MIFASHHLSMCCSPSFRLQCVLKLINLAQPLGVPVLQTWTWKDCNAFAACGLVGKGGNDDTTPVMQHPQTQRATGKDGKWKKPSLCQLPLASSLCHLCFPPQSSHQIIINVINKRRGQVIKCKICGVLLELAA